MRNGKDTDDDPRIRCDEMELLRRSQKEVQIGSTKLVEVLLPYFCEGFRFVALGALQTVPVEGTHFPVEHLELARAACGIFEPVGEAVRELRDHFERTPPGIVGKEVELIGSCAHFG